jgi:hypothetical protein
VQSLAMMMKRLFVANKTRKNDETFSWKKKCEKGGETKIISTGFYLENKNKVKKFKIQNETNSWFKTSSKERKSSKTNFRLMFKN